MLHRLSLAIMRTQRRTRRNLHQSNPNQPKPNRARRNRDRPLTTLSTLVHSATRVSEKPHLRPFVRPPRNRNQGKQGSPRLYAHHRLVVTSPGPRKPTNETLEIETQIQCSRRPRPTGTTRTTSRLMSSPSRLRLLLPRRWLIVLETRLPAVIVRISRPTPSRTNPRRIGA